MSRDIGTMSRDITAAPPAGIEPATRGFSCIPMPIMSRSPRSPVKAQDSSEGDVDRRIKWKTVGRAGGSGGTSPRWGRRFFAQLAEALGEAHEQNDTRARVNHSIVIQPKGRLQ